MSSLRIDPKATATKGKDSKLYYFYDGARVPKTYFEKYGIAFPEPLSQTVQRLSRQVQVQQQAIESIEPTPSSSRDIQKLSDLTRQVDKLADEHTSASANATAILEGGGGSDKYNVNSHVKQLDTLREEITRLQADAQQQQSRYDELLHAKQQTNRQSQARQSEIDDLRELQQQLEQDTADQVKSLTLSKRREEQLQSTIVDLQRERGELMKRLETRDYSGGNSRNNTNNTQYKRDFQILSQQIDALDERLEHAVESHEEAANTTASTRKALSGLKQERGELERLFASLEDGGVMSGTNSRKTALREKLAQLKLQYESTILEGNQLKREIQTRKSVGGQQQPVSSTSSSSSSSSDRQRVLEQLLMRRMHETQSRMKDIVETTQKTESELKSVSKDDTSLPIRRFGIVVEDTNRDVARRNRLDNSALQRNALSVPNAPLLATDTDYSPPQYTMSLKPQHKWTRDTKQPQQQHTPPSVRGTSTTPFYRDAILSRASKYHDSKTKVSNAKTNDDEDWDTTPDHSHKPQTTWGRQSSSKTPISLTVSSPSSPSYSSPSTPVTPSTPLLLSTPASPSALFLAAQMKQQMKLRRQSIRVHEKNKHSKDPSISNETNNPSNTSDENA